MIVTAWHNGGGVYGIRVGRANRAKHFRPDWEAIGVRLGRGPFHRFGLTDGFWNDCPEFRDAGTPAIREWLTAQRLVPWAPGTPPQFVLINLGANQFWLGTHPASIDRATAQACVDSAMDSVIERHADLLELNASERSLSHHLAITLAALLPIDLDVDVEYNRHGHDPKRLELPPRNASDRDTRATTVFPDIIVHKRNTDEVNILALEVKKPGEPLDYDARKLCGFRRELGYQHAAHVVLGWNSSGSIVGEVIWVDA